MPRLMFEKCGNAVWISHLDLMRLFQRAFKRAGLPLKHTQGFNPRPSVSIALPLSVGVESKCELLDFELDTTELVSNAQIVSRLNQSLVSGVKVLDCYDNGGKLRDLAFLHCSIMLAYDNGCAGAAEQIKNLLAGERLIVPKKTKNGIQDQDIIPMICKCEIIEVDPAVIELDMTVCCQNPTLNPMQVVEAIKLYLPQYAPDFVKVFRVELFDRQNCEFK